MTQCAFFDAIRIQELILKFPDPDKFSQDPEWRALRSDNSAVFNSQKALRMAMLHDVLVATLYEQYSGLKVVFNYGVFMAHVNDVERHYNMVVNELSWLHHSLCSKDTNWEVRIKDTPQAWQHVVSIMLGGGIDFPPFKTKKQIQGSAGGGDGNLYDPDHPLYRG